MISSNAHYRLGGYDNDVKKYDRWRSFWTDRVGEVNGQEGSLYRYGASMRTIAGQISCAGSPSSNSLWQNVEQYKDKVQGLNMVVFWAIEVDPHDTI